MHHDNAPAHTTMPVREILAKNKTVVMPQSPYSPYLDPADFFDFPKLKTTVKRKDFATIDEIKEKSKQELLAIPKIAFQQYFENWIKTLAKVYYI